MTVQTSQASVAERGHAQPDSNKLSDVQGLRGVAVLLVVLFHAGLPLNGGFVGVDVFFVISGFVIGRLLVTELSRNDGISLRRFYLRRIRRLVPAFSLLLTVVAVASALLQSPIGAQQDTALTGLGALVWAANGVLYLITGDYFDTSAEAIPLLHTWSLGVEEQFYLVFPALFAFSWWVARRTRHDRHLWLGGAVLMLSAISFAMSLWLSYGHALPGIAKPGAAAFYGVPTRAWEFGVGVLLALWLHGRASSPRYTTHAGMVGASSLLASSVLLSGTYHFPGWIAGVPVLATAALIYSGRGPATAASRVLSSAPLTWVGDLSYSWYLWHWPFIVFSRLLFDSWVVTAVAVVASLAVAWLSFRFVEEPIRRNRTATVKSSIPLIGTCVAIPGVLLGGLYVGADQSWNQPEISAMAAQVTPVPLGYAIGCHSLTPIGERDLGRCSFGAQGAGDTVWLIGDSNAGQYADGLVAASRSAGFRAKLATASGCPMITANVLNDGVPQAGCETFVKASLSWLREQPDATILVSAANEAIAEQSVSIEDPATGEVASTPAAKAALWTRAQASVLKQLEESGHRVILIKTIPHLEGKLAEWWTPSECLMPTLLSNVAECGVSTPLQNENERQALALAAEAAAATQAGAEILDLRALICPDGTCAAAVDGVWIFRDGLHISTVASETLAQYLVDAIERPAHSDG